MTELCF